MAAPTQNAVEQTGAAMPPGEGGSPTSPVREAVFSAARKLRDNESVLRATLRVFQALQKLGVSIVPNHYYWPIPDISALREHDWDQRMPPAGVQMHMEEQVEFLYECVQPYVEECNFPDHDDGSGRYHYHNGFFECVDAEVAYSVVRKKKPSRVIEVGGGYSSRVLSAALESNYYESGEKGELVTIDPFLERGASSGYDRAFVLRQAVQQVDVNFFASLASDDILFLDSSHVVAIGGDVVREYLEILPRLRPGVLVHVHDIFLPHDYPREFIYRNLCFWSEQYLLQAFLSFNSEFEVCWGSSAMALRFGDLLDDVLPRWENSYCSMPREGNRFVPTLDGRRVWPSSFWIRRK